MLTALHTQPTEGPTTLTPYQQVAELISAHVLASGQTVKNVLRALQPAPGTFKNDDFVRLAQELSDVGLYVFADGVSGRYAATVVDEAQWQATLSKLVAGIDLQNLAGLKIAC